MKYNKNCFGLDNCLNNFLKDNEFDDLCWYLDMSINCSDILSNSNYNNYNRSIILKKKKFKNSHMIKQREYRKEYKIIMNKLYDFVLKKKYKYDFKKKITEYNLLLYIEKILKENKDFRKIKNKLIIQKYYNISLLKSKKTKLIFKLHKMLFPNDRFFVVKSLNKVYNYLLINCR